MVRPLCCVFFLALALWPAANPDNAPHPTDSASALDPLHRFVAGLANDNNLTSGQRTAFQAFEKAIDNHLHFGLEKSGNMLPLFQTQLKVYQDFPRHQVLLTDVRVNLELLQTALDASTTGDAQRLLLTLCILAEGATLNSINLHPQFYMVRPVNFMSVIASFSWDHSLESQAGILSEASLAAQVEAARVSYQAVLDYLHQQSITSQTLAVFLDDPALNPPAKAFFARLWKLSKALDAVSASDVERRNQVMREDIFLTDVWLANSDLARLMFQANGIKPDQIVVAPVARTLQINSTLHTLLLRVLNDPAWLTLNPEPVLPSAQNHPAQNHPRDLFTVPAIKMGGLQQAVLCSLPVDPKLVSYGLKTPQLLNDLIAAMQKAEDQLTDKNLPPSDRNESAQTFNQSRKAINDFLSEKAGFEILVKLLCDSIGDAPDLGLVGSSFRGVPLYLSVLLVRPSQQLQTQGGPALQKALIQVAQIGIRRKKISSSLKTTQIVSYFLAVNDAAALSQIATAVDSRIAELNNTDRRDADVDANLSALRSLQTTLRTQKSPPIPQQ